MGHLSSKQLYKKLGSKIDNLTVRAPYNDALYSVLKTFYSEPEADVVIKMPYGLSDFNRIQKIIKYNESKLRNILDQLCSKGLVIDIYVNDNYYYMPSPFVIGIFEFTMMRTKDTDYKTCSKLLTEYFNSDNGIFFSTNFNDDSNATLFRTLPHETTIKDLDYTEILDYEKATAIIKESDKFSIGTCSCRHEKFHTDEKTCDFPLDTCASFGYAADFLIRNNMAKEVSKTKMLENMARSRELGLVFIADNVKKNVTFICNCCGCCCNVLAGLNNFGYFNALLTSNFIASIDQDLCNGCMECFKTCPIDAIEMIEESPGSKKKQASLDTSICLGCGVCCIKCKTDALKLIPRKEKIIYPETTFERTILQCLDKGTLQNQIFDNPQSKTQSFMRVLTGAFLKLPAIKKTLMSDILRSRFLKAMETGIKLQGKGWITKI